MIGPVRRPGLTCEPIWERTGRWARWFEVGLVGVAGAARFLHRVVDFEDDAFGAVVAAEFMSCSRLVDH
jgi:hypothetical protein